jgi:formate dehydrogenase
LERPDLPFIFPLVLGMQSKAYMAATEALVPIDGEQRDEATIYTDLAQACGVNLFDSWPLQGVLNLLRRSNRLFNGSQKGVPQRFLLDQMLRRSGNGTFTQMLAYGAGKQREAAQPGTFLGKRLTTEDGKLHLVTERLTEEAQQLHDKFAGEQALQASGQFRLISKRAHSTHNSWTQNIEELTNGKMGQSNYLYLHEDDAERIGLKEWEIADIRSDTGVIRLPVKLLNELMPGTVAVPHGWGHQQAKGLSVASQIAGANVNILVSDGPDHVEKISGMAHMTGIPVSITPAAGPLDPTSWSGIGAT